MTKGPMEDGFMGLNYSSSSSTSCFVNSLINTNRLEFLFKLGLLLLYKGERRVLVL